MEILQEWKQTAIKLGRSDNYVQRIREITEDYGKGKPLNENQRERFSQDFADYRAQLRQVQAQKQQQQGFSL